MEVMLVVYVKGRAVLLPNKKKGARLASNQRPPDDFQRARGRVLVKTNRRRRDVAPDDRPTFCSSSQLKICVQTLMIKDKFILREGKQ